MKVLLYILRVFMLLTLTFAAAVAFIVNPWLMLVFLFVMGLVLLTSDI